MNVLDVILRRGKKKDAIVANPRFFAPGIKVEIGRFANPGYDVIGSAIVEAVNEGDKVIKFDGLPAGARVGDVLVLQGESYPHETLICGVGSR